MLEVVIATAQRVWNLTNRETEVLSYIVKGFISAKDVAHALEISESTAGRHIESIARKTSLSGKLQVVTTLFRALCKAVEEYNIRQNPTTVAVVEDDDDTCELIVDLLNEQGFDAAPITSRGGINVDNIIKAEPEVLLCDLVLPYTNGVEIARILSRHCGSVPSVVLFTGYPDQVPIMQSDVFSVLLKPLNENQLVRTIQRGSMDYYIRRSLLKFKLPEIDT